jgi:hypothetical protein
MAADGRRRSDGRTNIRQNVTPERWCLADKRLLRSAGIVLSFPELSLTAV